MAERERVTRAIEAPVAEAAKLLSEASGADLETRLALRIDGWGRGLAAGLEELAVGLQELRRSSAPDEPAAAPSPARPPSQDGADEADDADDAESERAEPGERGEDDLRADAARSRAATEELREERERG